MRDVEQETAQTGQEREPLAAPAPTEPRPFALRLLTYCVFDPLIALFTTLFGCASLVASLWDRSGRQQHAIARLWARTLLRATWSPVTVERPADFAPERPAVYVVNHLSYMDTLVLFARMPFQFRIFAKQSLWKVPFIGWHLHRSGQIPVDQTTTRNAVAGLNRGVAALRGGLSLVLFPEGGRSPTGEVGPFLPGAAFMAIKAQVPLVPVTLLGTYELLPMHTYALAPRPLRLVIGEPIETAGMTTRQAEALSQRAYDVITRTYMQPRER